MKKFLLLADEMEVFFLKRGFDCTAQLDGYVARYSLECIRSELLFSPVSLRQRLKTVHAYVKKERVDRAFVNAVEKINESKSVMKMRLVIKRRIFLLFLILYFKNMDIVLKRKM